MCYEITLHETKIQERTVKVQGTDSPSEALAKIERLYESGELSVDDDPESVEIRVSYTVSEAD